MKIRSYRWWTLFSFRFTAFGSSFWIELVSCSDTELADFEAKGRFGVVELLSACDAAGAIACAIGCKVLLRRMKQVVSALLVPVAIGNGPFKIFAECTIEHGIMMIGSVGKARYGWDWIAFGLPDFSSGVFWPLLAIVGLAAAMGVELHRHKYNTIKTQRNGGKNWKYKIYPSRCRLLQ